MLYWGELGWCDPVDPSFRDTFKHIVSTAEITDLSIKHSLQAFLTAEGKVTAVFLKGQSEEVKKKKLKRKEGKAETPYKRFYIHCNEPIQWISCGKAHMVLVSETGLLLEWSYPNDKPRSFNSFSRQIAQVACGNDHSVVLTKDGQLFTWGENSSGQLGLGKGEPSSLSPQPLKSLCGIPLAQISAGGDHSFALSLSGAVFGWGRNSAGQLGLGDREDRCVPVCVKSLNRKKTVLISCGEDHTAVLIKGGQMFTFGSGCYGQLGHNSLRDELQPRLLGGLWGLKVVQIACGRHHTLALVRSSNTIYSFGCGEQGQLENGQKTCQSVPLPVHLPPEFSPNQTVERIIAGGNLSVACCAKQDGETVSASSSQRPCKEQTVLDDETIDRWILDCEKPKTWTKVKREIKRMFSSAACINGSFIDKSGDKHYKTSEGHSGLDLSLARLAFEKLAKKPKILLEVTSVVERDLLPSLKNISAVGVEALRIYLILPELIRVLNKAHNWTHLTVQLASAILNLDEASLKVLFSLYTRLPYHYYRTLVKIFSRVSAHLTEVITVFLEYWKEVLPLLKVLGKLYAVNSQRVKPLRDNCFYIKEFCDFFLSDSSYEIYGDEIVLDIIEHADLFLDYPFMLDMNSKCKLFIILQEQSSYDYFGYTYNSICVSRQTVLGDTLKYLRTNTAYFFEPTKVKFLQEEGIDQGGLRTEFYRLLSEDLKASNIIQASEDSGLYWFSADTSNTTDEFYYFGVICGMAFYNKRFINIGFPLALFKKLQNQHPTLSDLEELYPLEARGLKDLLKEDDEYVEALYQDFTVKGTELIPNGSDILVTKANRQKYVDLYVDFVFNKSVEHQFKEFARGFSRGNYGQFWTMFLPEELRLLLYGTSEYEWRELQKVATYEYYGPSDELIQNFWTVFFELSEELKKKFLIFMYATERLPVGGLSHQRLHIRRRFCENPDEYLPRAQTCFKTLELPNYSNIQILQEKLIHSITCCEDFGMQ